MRLVVLVLSLLSAAVLTAASTSAQTWPSRPVRLVVTFAPGGSSDIAARVFSQKLSDALGQQVFVENRVGAGGTVGADLVARAAPDGYTLVLSNVSPFTVSPVIFPNVPYDPVDGFTHVALIGAVPVVLIVHPDHPARSVADYVRMAKAEPGRIAYGSAGNGTVGHIVGEMFQVMADVQLLHVPYRGSAQMFVDLRAKAVPSSFDALPQNSEHIKAGNARALGVSAARRVAMAPEVPTFVEQGFPDLIGENWLGFSAPPGLPAEITARINREVLQIATRPDVIERLGQLGITHEPLTPAQFRDYVAREYARWRPIVQKAGVQAN